MLRRAVPFALAVVLLSSGTAAAATPNTDPGPDEYPNVATETTVPIPMDDGIVLRATVQRPADANGVPTAKKLPVILTMTPYNKGTGQYTGLAGVPPMLIRHGYVSVFVDVRGTGNSQGSWDSFGPREQKDSQEIVTWMNKQPWSDGTFATYGPSYMAINQFLLNATHPPGLKAMFPIIPAADVYRDVVWHGGSVDAGFIPLWMGLVTALGIAPIDELQADPMEALNVLLQRVTTGTEFQTTAVSSLLTKGDLAFDGEFFKVRSPENVVNQINVPTFITGGWWDLFQRGEPRLYQRLKLPPSQKKLIMGPWYHLTAGDGLGAQGAPPNLSNLALAWFDRWVKGKQNHIEEFSPVNLYEIGSGKWASQDTYPGPVDYKRLYLQPGRALASEKPAKAQTDTVLANPINGLCTRSTAQWTAGLIVPGAQCTDDQRLYEASGLTYTTAPLKEQLRIVGPLSLTMRASTTASDTTWIATLSDVGPDGKSNPITSGWLMPSRRAIDESRSVRDKDGDLVVPFHPFTQDKLLPVKSGEVNTLNVELFGTHAVFEPGHRVRLTLTHGDLPHLLSTVPDTVNQVGAVDSVHIDPADPSFLTIGEQIAGPLTSSTRTCTSRRSFTIRLKAPRRGVSIRKATVKVGTRTVKVTRKGGRYVAKVNLKGTPKKTVTVRVKVIGSDGRTYTDTRRYKTCAR